MRARFGAIALAAGLALLSTGNARGDAFDRFGFGARAEALGGAMVAEASGVEAAFYNPAGVPRTERVQALLGYGYGFTRLRLDGQDARVTSPHGTTLGLAVPIELGALRAAFGLALYLPDQYLARIQVTPPLQPHFVILGNEAQRLIVQPSLSLRWRWLSVGAGVTVLADALGNGVQFDVGLQDPGDGGKQVGRGTLDVALPLRVAPVVGAQAQPLPWLRFGVMWRGKLDLRVKLDVAAHVDVAGAVQGDALISLAAVDHYMPQQLTLGLAADLLPSLTATAQLTWLDWSAFDGGIPELKLRLAFGITPSLPTEDLAALRFHDVWQPRLGVEWHRRVGPDIGLAARLGLSYQRSPVPDQIGATSFADNDTVLVATGAGIELPSLGALLARPLRLDLAFGWHELLPRGVVKDPALSPGRGFTSDGRILHLSASLGFTF